MAQYRSALPHLGGDFSLTDGGIETTLGFVPGVRIGLGCEYDVPAEAFMVLELRPGALRGAPGRVPYHAAFASL